MRLDWTKAVTAAVLVLLPLLAFLQYRWIGQVSRAEHERMRESLRTGIARFRLDFNQEITRAFAVLQSNRPADWEFDVAERTERYESWLERSPNRDIFLNVYLAEGDRGGTSSLYQYSGKSGAFEPCEWPSGFAEIRSTLEARAAHSGPPFRPLIDEGASLLIAPRLRLSQDGRFPMPGRFEGGGPMRTPSIAGWSIAELNLDYLRQELAPLLMERHFHPTGRMDFQIEIRSRSKPDEFIYRSHPELPVIDSSPDASTGVLELPMDLGRGRGVQGGMPMGPPFGPPGRPGLLEEGPPPPRRPPGDEPGIWILSAQHLKGSLDDAVTETRRRNLAVSFAILLLMGASVGTLVISTRRAQRLARMQMEFVAGVSHELRTPLAVICSAGDNLADGVVSDGRQVKRYGTVIRNEGRRLTEMVEQVLGFAGAQSGRAKYHFQRVDVGEVIEQALDSRGASLREAGIAVEKRIAAGLPAAAADANLLAQCVGNLITNAVKYGGEGGWIGVTAEACGGKRPEVRISVRDKGAGIDASDMPHIFEPFYRGARVVAAQIHGAGLGLSLVKQTIEAHGGSVEASSKPGQGSCFTLILPALEPAAAEDSGGVEPRSALDE